MGAVMNQNELNRAFILSDYLLVKVTEIMWVAAYCAACSVGKRISITTLPSDGSGKNYYCR